MDVPPEDQQGITGVERGFEVREEIQGHFPHPALVVGFALALPTLDPKLALPFLRLQSCESKPRATSIPSSWP